VASRAEIVINIVGNSLGLNRELKKSSADVQKFSRDVEKSTRQIGALGNVVQGVFQGIGQAIFQSLANGVRAGVGEIGKAIDAASDLNESLSKTNVAFGDSADEILAWSKTSANAFGQSRQQALEAASSFGLLFSSMGVTREESARMSRSLVELASDIASINNLSPEEALEKLRSGLVGETEPLRTVGVLLSAVTVEAKALELGLADTAAQLTEQDKVMARYQLILDQTALSQGDFARTSDQLANSQRILAAQVEDSSARFGQALLPIQLAFTKGLSELITIVEPYGLNIMDSLASGLAQGIVSILPVLAQVRALFTYWLKPGSPPRLLKELTDWGQSAMQEYLRGWTLADFDALRSVGGIIEQVVRSFAASGEIKETDLVSRVFGTQRAMTQAIRDFRELGFVSEATLGSIADAAGPAGSEVAGLVREYFELQQATRKVSDAQDELNSITDRYAKALNPLQGQLDSVRAKQQEIRENQRLEELGDILSDPRADVDDRRLARLEAEEIQLERQARALETERDAALDGVQQKLDAAKKEEDAQRSKFQVAQEALDQQTRTNALIEEEASLRERLANEALAAQEKALRELEAEQRKYEAALRAGEAEMKRVTDAELRWRLASTDTAGQLAIMRDELAKTQEGSADYFDILTQIVNLEERLTKERSAGSNLFTPILDAVGSTAEVEQASKGIAALSSALDEAFKVLAGGDGKEVELAPAWQNFADTLGTIGDAAQEVGPIIKSVIDLVMGKDVDGLDTTTDPFGDNWWLSGIVPGVNNIIKNLGLLRDDKWAEVWAGFKEYVADVVNSVDPAADPRTFGLYAWLADTLIPAIEALAVGDWKTAWELLAEAPINAFQGVIDKVQELFSFEEQIQKFMEKWGFPTNPFEPGSGPNSRGQDYLPPSDFSSFPGVTPGAPLMPALAGASNMTNSGNTVINVEQHIATNGDFGGARQGALEGIRQALINRTLQGA
jgi:hypothetical protein